MIARFLKRVGFLRALMMAVTVALAALAPFSGGYVQTGGWPLITTLVAPVSFVIFAFVLCLDMLMTGVFMSGSRDEERRRFNLILRSEGVLLALLLACWTPFVLELLRAGEG